MKHWFYILFFFSWAAAAQTQLFTVEDGLSNKEITCVLQSQNGYLWVGTASGLNFYEGYTFRPLNRDNGLSYGKVKCIYEDKKGLLWIGTWDGLTILDQQTGTTKRYFNKEKNSKANVINSEVTAIAQSPDGSILVGIGNGTLLHFKDENTYTTIFQLPAREKVYKYQIYSIRTAADSSVLLLTNYASVWRLDKQFREDSSFTIDLEAIINIDMTDAGRTLVAVGVHGTVMQVSPQNGKPLPGKPVLELPHLPGVIYAGYLTSVKELWTGTTEGFLTATQLSTRQSTDYSRQIEKYVAGSTTSIYEDKKGVLWIGTNYGLIRFYPRKRLFENYLNVEGGDFKSKNSIRGMIEDEEGTIFIGGYNGLFKIRQQAQQPEQLVFTALGASSLTANYPYRLLGDKNCIWMTSETRGFMRFNKISGRMEFPISTSDFFKAYALLPNDKSSLWIGTHNGLFLYNKITARLQKYKHPSDLVDISNVEVMELVRDNNGRVWIGTSSSGLFEMKEKGGIIRHLSEATTSLPINCISTLFSENDSILWAGTRGEGLFRINTVSGKITVYTKKNGLADNAIAGIEKDNAGNYWISTFNGLSKFDLRSARFENYYGKDGLTENEFNISAHLKTRAGKLYFGGLNGVNGFYPANLKKELKQDPHIFLTHFAKYNGASDKLEERQLDLRTLKNIDLSYKDKFFSFSFALDDYYDPLRSTFFYKLEGYDNDWTNMGTQTTIRFNSLPPGQFMLRIRGMNSEGQTSTNELQLSVFVSRAFYNTWWFYTLLFVATVALVVSVTRYKIYQGLKINRLRTKISSDLHDEVGSLLTRITIQAELMKQGISTNTPVEEVAQIADTSRLATAAMSDVLWSIDGRNDKIGNLLDRFREQAGEILFPLGIAVNFQVRNIDPEKQIDNSSRQNLFLIFKEAIHNIAKHSSASKADIVLENRGNRFFMVIEDNGAGQPPSNKGSGQGLRNMHMRAERMEGLLTIEKENGYRVTLKIKKI